MTIFCAERSLPTSTAHAVSVQPVCWKPISSRILFICSRSTTSNSLVLTMYDLITSDDRPGDRGRYALCQERLDRDARNLLFLSACLVIR